MILKAITDQMKCIVCFVWHSKESSKVFTQDAHHEEFIQLVTPFTGHIEIKSKKLEKAPQHLKML